MTSRNRPSARATRARFAGAFVVVVWQLLGMASARAQSPDLLPAPLPLPPGPTAPGSDPAAPTWAGEVTEAAPPPPRARLSASVGVGATFDRAGLIGARTAAVPAFQVQVGFGESFLGVDLRLFSSQASGRFHQMTSSSAGMLGAADMPADRLALDLMLALRPLSFRYRTATHWRGRVAASLTFNVGVAAENAATGTPSVLRFGPVIGAHLDLPLFPASRPSALRVRLTVRKMLAADGTAGAVAITNTSGEVFGGLAVVF